MPWNNQSGGGGNNNNNGPWGNKGGGGPWGQGPKGGGNQPPDLEELLKRSQDRLRKAMPGGGGTGGGIPGWAIMLLAALGIAFTAFSAFTFRVNPDEVGIVMRFGQYVRRADPGIHFRWPPPVEEVRFPKITRQNTLQVGMKTADRGRGYSSGATGDATHMLTGDENIVDINFVVRWQIKGERVQDYLFNIQNPELTVEEVAESVMREVVGKSNIQPILTEARQKIEQEVQKLMQDVLDSYGAGVRIVEVQLQRVDPPQEVIDSFRDVQAARADKERLQNEAATYANKIVPEARGEADRILQGAEGYKQQTIADANGQASRFLKVYEEYRKAPEVTRQRMYIETMERVLSQSDTIILDQKGGQGVVPYLPLDQLQQKRKEGN